MIKIEELYKSYAGAMVLSDINLHIPTGESFVILGESGVGKSVLLRQIIGLEKPDSGRIYINQEEITNLREKELRRIRDEIGLLFQENALFDFMTVGENIVLPLYEHNRLAEADFHARALQKMAEVHLEAGKIDKYPNELSGGMKKRAALARTLSLEPQIILYDEPTAGLDPGKSNSICKLIKSLQKNQGTTSVVVTHDLEVALKIADLVAFLYKGRVIFQGTVDEFRQSNTEIIHKFIKGES